MQRRIDRLAVLILCAGLVSLEVAVFIAQAQESPPPAELAPVIEGDTHDRERWEAFKQHIESSGRKELLPEERKDEPVPSRDAIVGILFRLSPDLAAAQEAMEKEPPDTATARARLEKLRDTSDPYVKDYALLFSAQLDLREKKFAEAQKGFEAVVGSGRNLASAPARKGLVECYRGQNETTLELLELRFYMLELGATDTAERGWAAGRLAEIRHDHPGPLSDSAKRMEEIAGKLGDASKAPAVSPDQRKVEEILLKVAKLLEEEAKQNGQSMMTQSEMEQMAKKKRQMAQKNAKNGKGKKAGKKNGKDGKEGDPKDGKNGPAKDSDIAKNDPRGANLKESTAKDQDAWGKINERDVARSLQDLWGKVPPEYRQLVAQYFKDIAGLEGEGEQKK